MVERYHCPECNEDIYVSTSEWIPELLLTPFHQKNKDINLGCENAKYLDAMCDVPSIPEDYDYDKLAKWMLGDVDNWQRTLDTERIEDIGMFWASRDSYFVNPIIIGVKQEIDPEITSIDIMSEDKLIVDKKIKMKFNNWLVNECPRGHTHPEGLFFDKCPDHRCEFHIKTINLRPLHIIDGQHRVRGTQNGSSPTEMNPETNKLFSEENLLFVLLRSDGIDGFDLRAQAKIFTEITTKGEELNPNHKIFLMYKFNQRGIVDSRYEKVDMRYDYPDYKAYQACLQAIGPDFGNESANPLRNKVPPIKGRQHVSRVASLSFIYRSIRPLFNPGHPFDGKASYDVAKTLVEFCQAIKIKWDRTSPISDRYYWYPPHSRPNPEIEKVGIISTPLGGDNSTWLRILFRLMEDIIKAAQVPSGLPSRRQYEKVLDEISQCNFDGDGWDQIPGQEKRENYIENILRNIITKKNEIKVEMSNHGINDINTYVAKLPLLQDITLNENKQSMQFYYPMNAFSTARITFIQDSRIIKEVLINPNQGVNNIFQFPEGWFKPGNSSKVIVTLFVQNPNGQSEKSMELDPPI